MANKTAKHTLNVMYIPSNDVNECYAIKKFITFAYHVLSLISNGSLSSFVYNHPTHRDLF